MQAAALAVLCTWLAGAGLLLADTLVEYDFEGSNMAASVEHPQITADDFDWSGDGTPDYVTGHGGGTAFGKSDWTPEAGPADYFYFALVIEAGYIVDVTNVLFYNQRSGQGPTNWIVKYSTDGSTFHNLGEDLSNTDIDAAADPADARPVFDEVSFIDFRIYATNAGDGAGTWRVDDVTVLGDVRIDDGTRRIWYQGFDGSPEDNWGLTTNASTAVFTTTTERAYEGHQSLRMPGSTLNEDPNVTFDAIPLGTVSNPVVSVAFAADGPDSDDDLYLEVSYDGGSTWAGAGTTQLVDGFGNVNLDFGEVIPARVPPGVNPYSFAVPATETQMMVRVQYYENSGDNTDEVYYVDSVMLSGIPWPGPSTSAPSIANYGPPTDITTAGATVRAHVRGGFPYPAITLYWGFVDGVTNSSEWMHETVLGAATWGIFTNVMTGLEAGQVYYYRWYAESGSSGVWADTSTNFTTAAGALAAGSRMFLDSFGVDTVMPLSIDLDGNDLSDRWEEEYLGGIGNLASGDGDNDGVSNEREQWAGTDPNDSNSYMRIVSVDLPSEASDDVAITWRGGDFVGATQFMGVGDSVVRVFRVLASDNPAAVKAAAAAVDSDPAGTQVWTDTNAVQETTERYYGVAVDFGGRRYTNAIEWAMHVQDRRDGYRYLASVPVDLGVSNNLDSQLGAQLARGLFAGASDADSDYLSFRTSTNTWKDYHLVTNAQGDRVWWDFDQAATADLAIAVGTGFWVVRQGTGPRPRTNTVLVGRSFTNAGALSFSTNYGGWNVFGWPFGKRGGQENDGALTATNQLGFAAVATGGRTRDEGRPGERGDQIWRWEDNHWKPYYWLLGNVGAQWDGRWWDSSTREFAEFELKPGVGYYFLHFTNFGGTNFTWTPQMP